MTENPIRPTDDKARALAKTLLRTARSGSLATIEAGTGHPFASLVSLATDLDGTPLILTSTLSGHTGNLAADPRASLLLSTGGRGDPLAHPRITLIARGRKVDRETDAGRRIRRRFLARQPKAELYVDFGDFAFWALDLERASLNAGFGRAYELARADIVTDLAGAEAMVEVEAGAVEHMNADHAEALELYATKLLGAEPGPWRCTGLDPEGLDLALGDATLRLAFPERVAGAGPLRLLLKRLADQARAA
jgi:putative heme iron utilization protein